MTRPDALPASPQTFRVGGSIRDELLGLPSGDRDWVVVGATPEQMLARGFKAVGKDFPVFLHPQTHEEYALARTERKTAPGYKGFSVHFSPDVTLEEDLQRRDLTINAIASATDGRLIDPFHGQADIQARIFRHISPAFREDPVRILRLARFAARFPDFTIAPETITLMRDMSAAGEVHALVAERVWQEISRGLMSARPSRMLQALASAHALPILIPGLPSPDSQPDWLAALDASAAAGDPLPVRFALLMAGLNISAASTSSSDAQQRVLQQARALRASNDCTDTACRLAAEIPGAMPQSAQQWFQDPDRQKPAGLIALFNRHDAWRRPERLSQMLTAAQRLACASGQTAADDTVHICQRMEQALAAANRVNTGDIARQHQRDPARIRQAIDAAREAAIAQDLAST
ncbi:MAG: multifunctional CCA tRNA nucleotidyl transferase/2'3'-cyclic phosphodiesterase/2'nucleotidase/phosphatase [Lautropia sp.]|nr:multifunctional CCA tRNA nucleotidyl transferase/2'3'-cyclic phosphodiesterase/2'nucleotidase/phosphatase [Lautropia sp.]